MKSEEVRYFLAAACLLIMSMAGVAAQVSSEVQPATERERREAKSMWGHMLEVKGGRAQLHTVENMLLTLGTKPNDTRIDLYVFPGKLWTWKNAPPSQKVVWVHMTNPELGVRFVASNTGLISAEKMTEELSRDIRWGTLQEACAHLLENKWLQPKPLRVTRQRVGKNQMDVIETHLRDEVSGREERLDFVVEPESLLVRRVLLYFKGKPLSYYCFDNYAPVSGILMPQRTGKTSYRFWEKQNCLFYSLAVRFNVEYDPGVFEHPPTVAAGPEAWKPKR